MGVTREKMSAKLSNTLASLSLNRKLKKKPVDSELHSLCRSNVIRIIKHEYTLEESFKEWRLILTLIGIKYLYPYVKTTHYISFS